jgi:hypothetical protein
VPLQHQSEALLHLSRRRADGDRARDVGGAVEVLGTRVDEIELADTQLAVGGGGHPVMDDGPIWARTRDGVEADLLQRLRLAADGLEPARDGNLIEPPSRRLAVEPGEEAGHGCPVALAG